MLCEGVENDVHTTKSIEQKCFYSLKVLAHFRSKALVDFSTFYASLAPQYNTYYEMNIFRLSLHRFVLQILKSINIFLVAKIILTHWKVNGLFVFSERTFIFVIKNCFYFLSKITCSFVDSFKYRVSKGFYQEDKLCIKKTALKIE
jgi:hypothetical protein